MQLGFDMAPVLPRKAAVPFRESTLDASETTPPGESVPPPPVSSPNAVLTVVQLTRRISSLLEEGVGSVWVEGEISNLRRQASGHTYFTLKDEESQLACVLFARAASGQKTELRDGLQVQLHGRIGVYQLRGRYQLTVRLVQAKGEGLLQARFEELKARLAAEGLFDQGRKRPLPRFPRRIGVVTSPTGAAIRDFLQVLHRRHPGLRVLINPVRVQGKGAAAEIAAAISELASAPPAFGPVDVIVLTRGGGGLEDLWEFNEEAVARAIATSPVPVVSAVGHEIDFSIADFVADLRAPTPSAAAELLAADGGELMERCRQLAGRIGREAVAALQHRRAGCGLIASSPLFREPLRRINEARQTGDRMEEAFAGIVGRREEQVAAALATATARLRAAHPGQRCEQTRQRVRALGDQLGLLTLSRIDRERGRFARLRSALTALSPEATLARGFSITRNAKGHVVTSSSQVAPGDQLRTQIADGEILSEVEEPGA